MPDIAEATRLAGSTATSDDGSRTYRLRIIEGDRWGSSCYYPADVVEAGGPTAWPIGTHCYMNHPSASESLDQPERRVQDLAGVIATTPVYEASNPDGSGLYADVRVLPTWAPVVEAAREHIGVSIRGTATMETAERAGRIGPVATAITSGISVDFVTHAGAGGAILNLVESARGTAGTPVDAAAAAAAGGHPDTLLSAPVREALPGGLSGSGLRAALSGALDAAYDTPGDPSTGVGYVWSYLRDWDDTTVVFSLSGSGAPANRLQAQTYTATTGGVVTLTGTAVPVTAQTSYLTLAADGSAGAPVFTTVAAAEEAARATLRLDAAPTDADRAADARAAAVHDLTESLTGDRRPQRPATGAAPTESHRKGTAMPEIQENRLRDLEAAEAQVPTLITERDTARTDLAAAVRRAQLAEAGSYARDFAHARVTEANADLSTSAVNRIVAAACRDLPLQESGADAGRLDTVAFAPIVDAARTHEETYLASVMAEAGVGAVRGLGASSTEERYSDKAVGEALGRLWGRPA